MPSPSFIKAQIERTGLKTYFSFVVKYVAKPCLLTY